MPDRGDDRKTKLRVAQKDFEGRTKGSPAKLNLDDRWKLEEEFELSLHHTSTTMALRLLAFVALAASIDALPSKTDMVVPEVIDRCHTLPVCVVCS